VKIAWVFALALWCGCGGTPAAARPVPPPAARRRPTLVGEMQKLSFYVGDWSCQGTIFATATDPQETFTARVEVRPDAGGAVVAVHMIGPGDSRSAEVKGYDPATRTWFHFWATRDGGRGSLSSDGWEGQRLVAYDDATARPRRRRTVFSKLAENRFSHREEAESETGFRPVWEKVCEKSAR